MISIHRQPARGQNRPIRGRRLRCRRNAVGELRAGELAADLTGVGVEHCLQRRDRLGLLQEDRPADHLVDVGGAKRDLNAEPAHQLL